uniref:Uncharacterized protein n=1 Tax=Tanacetum cinerariifolium TaxID=118510 RepID=A0A6L2NX85_TANCI|nr:hypothetical protein [Tanacetum cinerariifolium]
MIRGSKTVNDIVLKHDLCELVIAEIRTVITNDDTRGSKPSKERFQEFTNNSGIIGVKRFRFNLFRQVVDGHEEAFWASCGEYSDESDVTVPLTEFDIGWNMYHTGKVTIAMVDELSSDRSTIVKRFRCFKWICSRTGKGLLEYEKWIDNT